jgi:hypothetical protein
MYSQNLKRIKRILVLSFLLCGGPIIFVVLTLPSSWIYDDLAVRKAFGTHAPAGLAVQQIKKPYTVTFSNGQIADVGPIPAIIGNLFHFGIGIPAVLTYFYLIKRAGPEWFRSGKWMRSGVSIIED